MALTSDPFLEVQADVQQTLTSTRHLFSSHLRIRSLNPTGPETQQSHHELITNLETIETDLTDLHDSISAVESDPYRFGLDVAEVQRRRHFVRQVEGEIQGMRNEIGSSPSSHSINRKIDGNNNNVLPSPSTFSPAHADERRNEDSEDEDTYTAFEHQQQQTMFREQDEQLDDVYRTVHNLHGQAETMGRELEEQAGMLNDVDVLADRVGGKLSGGMKKIGEVIRRNEEGWSSCCIGVLIMVLVVLLVLVIAI